MDTLFSCQGVNAPYQERSRDNKKVPVAMRLGVTPVPIPNTMVKTQAADGTLLETARESRWLPELKKSFISDLRLKIFLVLDG